MIGAIVRSAVSAGDSMVGAMTLGLDRGVPLGTAVCFGLTAGAALMTPGTEFFRRDDAERLFAEICASGCVPRHMGPHPDPREGPA